MNGKWVYSLAILWNEKLFRTYGFCFLVYFYPEPRQIINGATGYKKIAVKSLQTDSCPLFLKAEKVIVISL